ncbi:MAG TPA: B12-binding domain-containing protein [Pyrinomonadaceae bacterium]|nr:B12-binding domain-containing protein [Pyrinomonadaceae bacterium]
MAAANLTTKDVARLLLVSEATVKRWADDGLLLPRKTVGGHRRFSIQSVARLRHEQGIAPAAQSPTKRVRKKTVPGKLPSADSFSEVLLSDNEAEATAQLIDAYMQNHALATLFDATITKAMHRVGDLWFNGTITIADEHLATRVMLCALQKLRSIVVPGQATGLKAVSCGIEGDLHELPIHLAEIIFESEGWDISNLGPNTPLFTLRDMVAQKKPDLVCISARSIVDLDRATTEYAQLRRIVEKINGTTVLGCEAFRDPNLRQRFPAEFYAQSFEGLATFVKERARKK